jgi:hypothetical protein
LDQGTDFPGKRGLKGAKAGDHVDGGGSHQDKNVTADHGDRDPERYRQMLGNGHRIHAAHRQHHERSNQHQLIGNGIENRAEGRLLMKTASQQAVQPIGDSGDYENRERQQEFLIKEQRDEDGNQRHSEDGQYIWQGNDARGH